LCQRCDSDDDDDILIKQKGKEKIREIELNMKTVVTQWNIQDDNWEKRFIFSSNVKKLAEKYRKQ
jgi:hypothetical protein